MQLLSQRLIVSNTLSKNKNKKKKDVQRTKDYFENETRRSRRDEE